MQIRATILCENCVFSGPGALAEHGWSVFLETEHGNYLFDTGGGKTIINNARQFGKNLSEIKGIILSHHHYDHTGGLLSVLEHANKVKVYTHPKLFKNSYSVRNGVERYIGIPYRRELLENKGAEFIFNTDFTEIAPGIMLTGEVPRKTSFEKGDPNLKIKCENGYLQDTVIDDQALILNTSKGLVIILGCSHAGIINTINYAIEKTGQRYIHTIFGGTHLGLVDKETEVKSLAALKEFEIGRIGTSHCTGPAASFRVFREFGERFFFCNVGVVINV